MPDYYDLELTADAEQLRQDARDWMTDQAPAGFVITPLIDWILGAVARMAVLLVVLAGRVPKAIVQIAGERLLKIAVLEATAATGTATFTLIDNPAGRTIPEGAQLDVDGQPFLTTATLTLAGGALSGSVGIVAVNPGAAGSGLQAPVELVTPTYVWVDSVSLTAATTGGRDGETPDEYVDRFADETPTLSTKAILIADFEALARRDLEVERALAIDNFVPPSTTGVEGAVTVALQGAGGANVSSAAKTRVKTSLEADRVLGITVHVIDATVTDVDVAFTFTTRASYIAAAVKTEAEAAVRDFLSKARHGVPPEGPANAWVNEPTIVRNDLFGVLYDVPGIRHVTALTLGPSGGTLAASDLALTGPAAVPNPVTVTGTPA